jgi:DNA primase
MGRISDEDVQRVRDATDLVQLVSESVVLKKRGRLFWGNCPFHGEKTPSFKIDPTTQLWHCFGCGLGGDAFGFAMRQENLEFPDAVRRLAERARIEIVEEGSTVPPGRKERLLAACEAAAEYFHSTLTTSKSPGANAAREYLQMRGFGIDVAKRWRLGYAPAGRGEVAAALMKRGFTRDELIDANIALPSDAGALKDRFFNRLMFPISDLHGRVVAFGGRVIGDGVPKYLNSNETLVFHKSSNLYGIDRSRNEIVASGTAIVVEGYTDVIAMHEAGLRAAVATLGTALSERHVRLLGRFAKRVVYLFDGDEAGLRAATRAAEFIDWHTTPESGASRTDLAVAVIPDRMDPADFVAAHGAELLGALVAGAQPLLQFVIDQRIDAHDLSAPEGKAAALKAAVEPLVTVRGSILAQEYVAYVAGRLLTDEALVRRALDRAAKESTGRSAAGTAAAGETGRAEPAAPPMFVDDLQARAEDELLRVVTQAPSVRERARELLTEEFVLDGGRRQLLGWVVEAGNATGEALFASIAKHDQAQAERITAWLVDAPDVEQVEYAFSEIAVRLKDSARERLILAKKAALRALDPVKQSEAYDQLFREIAELQRARQTARAQETSTRDMKAE